MSYIPQQTLPSPIIMEWRVRSWAQDLLGACVANQSKNKNINS